MAQNSSALTANKPSDAIKRGVATRRRRELDLGTVMTLILKETLPQATAMRLTVGHQPVNWRELANLPRANTAMGRHPRRLTFRKLPVENCTITGNRSSRMNIGSRYGQQSIKPLFRGGLVLSRLESNCRAREPASSKVRNNA